MRFGPWQDGFADAPWYVRLVCAVIGHSIDDGHPRVQDCRRCHAYRRKLDTRR